MSAGRHALGWLVAANAVGLWLSILILLPGLQAGEWTYGRWVPVHLNGMLYGWTALPLVAWLLTLYRVPRKWADVASWAWTAALLTGVISWLSGHSSGKVFLDWQGGPLAAITAAMGFLWIMLVIAWWRRRGELPVAKRRALAAGLAFLALVPFAMWQAASASVYPPVNPASGGPTGASLLGSTLVVVVLLLMLPRSCGLRSANRSLPWRSLAYLGFSAVVCVVAEARGGTHRDPLQILALGMLLPWPVIIARDWRAFPWPDDSRHWRNAVFFWWALLVVSGFIVFLPGMLDRMKFTNGLVAHSHLAMAGFTTSFCALLLRLLGQRFGRDASLFAWHLAAAAMVLTLALTGWAEGAGPAWMNGNPWWRFAALVLRCACGAIMLGAAIHWLLSWRPALPDGDILTDHETHRLFVESGLRRDGCADRPATGYFSRLGDSPAGDSGAGIARLPELGRRVRRLRRSVLRAGAARDRRSGDRVELHRSGEIQRGALPGGESPQGSDAGPVAERRGDGRDSGGRPMHGPAQGLVAGTRRLTLPLRAAGVVAMVYAHFLIFAQFAWIELMRVHGGTPGSEKLALGAMAFAGITGGFLVALKGSTAWTLRLSLVAASVAAAFASRADNLTEFVALSMVTGAAIGVMTVSLAPLLPRWCGLAWVGLGTGIGYALCNLPPIFMASPGQQAFVAALFTLAGALLVPGSAQGNAPIPWQGKSPGMVAAIATFTALVWMDSAAFFIIQHSLDLKTATWGSSLLWRNAALHLGAALLAGWTLRRGISGLLLVAWLILAVAALAVNDPHTRAIAGWWYPVGVSVYSTALVAWPGYFSSDGAPRRIVWRAAWLYAVAGWFGSANGIGMVQSLKRVPAEFVVAAGVMVVVSMLLRRSAWRSVIAILAVVLIGVNMNSSPPPQADSVSRGRSVYIAEGCINCHSRYIRPASRDELDWGPVGSTAAVMAEKPVLIGNRRQGPDLSNVGLRRSGAWLKLHFLNPRDLSPGSAMPSYRYLFEDSRGEDLIAFLQDFRPEAWQERQAAIASWTPAAGASRADPAILFAKHCAMCHGPDAHGGGALAAALAKPPSDLATGPFIWTPSGPDLEARLARVVKFGIPGTDMPGHETLQDGDVAGLAKYLGQVREAKTPPPGHE